MTAPGTTSTLDPVGLVPTEEERRAARREYGARVRELAEATGVPCYPPSEDERFAAWIAAHGSPELQTIGALAGYLRVPAGVLAG